MDKVIGYFKNIGLKRFIVMFVGNLILGFGISIFKFAGMGNDPYTAQVFGVADYIGIYFPIYQICFNAVVFLLIQLTLGRKYIGAGTIVNMFLLGYFVDFFAWTLSKLFKSPSAFLTQFPVMLIGVLVTCFGISLYQTSDAGVSPYDSVSIIMSDRIKKLPYFWARMITDAICALICFLSGGLLGLGTIVCAFGLGPVVHFFNKTVSEPFLNGKNNS